MKISLFIFCALLSTQLYSQTSIAELEKQYIEMQESQEALKKQLNSVKSQLYVAGNKQRKSLQTSIIGTGLIGLGSFLMVRSFNNNVSGDRLRPAPVAITASGIAISLYSFTLSYNAAKHLEYSGS